MNITLENTAQSAVKRVSHGIRFDSSKQWKSLLFHYQILHSIKQCINTNRLKNPQYCTSVTLITTLETKERPLTDWKRLVKYLLMYGVKRTFEFRDFLPINEAIFHYYVFISKY